MIKGTIELQNELVKLRRYTAEDIPMIHEKLGLDPEMDRYTGWNPYQTMESAGEFITEIIGDYDKGGNDYGWVIEADGRPVGTMGAYDYQSEDDSIEIGYSIFREYWGNGYVSAAVKLVCDFLLTTEGYSCIRAWSAVDNGRSKRALEKNGFVQTQIAEDGINARGETFDQVFYERRRE